MFSGTLCLCYCKPCYKCVQVPQFILEDAAERQQGVRIFCTQPRRLPVLAVSARVAKERNEKLGLTVGYHIRLEQKYASLFSSNENSIFDEYCILQSSVFFIIVIFPEHRKKLY